MKVKHTSRANVQRCSITLSTDLLLTVDAEVSCTELMLSKDAKALREEIYKEQHRAIEMKIFGKAQQAIFDLYLRVPEQKELLDILELLCLKAI